MRFKTFLFIVILFLSGSPAYSQSHANDEQALKQIVGKMLEAQVAFDPASLDNLFTADYVEISPAGEFDSRANVLTSYSPAVKAGRGAMAVSAEAVDHSIRVYDNFAIVIAQFNFTITVGGKPIPARNMRVTMVFRKQKGDWKLASAQYTGIWIPEPPAPPAKQVRQP